MAGDVGDPAAEGEQRGERQQVAVDDPLGPGGLRSTSSSITGIAIETIV